MPRGSSNEGAGRIFRLSPCGALRLLCAGSGVFHVSDAPALSGGLAAGRAQLCGKAARRAGGAALSCLDGAGLAAGRSGEHALQPRGRDDPDLFFVRQPADAGIDALWPVCGRDACGGAALVHNVSGRDDVGQICLSLWPRDPRAESGAVDDAALCAKVPRAAARGAAGAPVRGQFRKNRPNPESPDFCGKFLDFSDVEPGKCRRNGGFHARARLRPAGPDGVFDFPL